MKEDVLNLKTTQGHKKELQRVSDLMNNKIFQEKLQHIKALPEPKMYKEIYKLCKNYNLDFSYFSTELFMNIQYGRPICLVGLNKIDTCLINDDWDENLNSVYKPVPLKYSSSKKIRYINYPISISISTTATQRDVLDFIKKRWNLIRDMLDVYNEKPKRIRIRYKDDRNTFVWKNRKMNKDKLISLLDKRFPKKNGYGYEDIYTIINQEKKRRSEK